MLVALILAISAPVLAGDDPSPDCVGGKVDRKLDIRRERQKLGMTETRWFGLALECYAIDHHSYPGPTKGVETVRFLVPALIPQYREYLPVTDTWGSDYLYWSDGIHYILISVSADRKPDVDYDAALGRPWEEAKKAICLQATHDPNADLVFMDGQHCRWFQTE
jgi:hypothetical protein